MNYKGYFLIGALFILLFSPFISANAAPTPINPTSNDSPIWKGIIKFKWNNTETEFSQYYINLPDGTQLENIKSTSSDSIHGLEVGAYNWAIRSCETKECAKYGDWSETQTFNIILLPSGTQSGLVVCGAQYYNPDTPYDESEPCRISHLFLLLKILLDFVLWKAGLIVIGIMTIITAVTSFLSFGYMNIISQIKAIWKSILIGYLIMLLAWLAINVILNFFGFEFQWWAISF